MQSPLCIHHLMEGSRRDGNKDELRKMGRVAGNTWGFGGLAISHHPTLLIWQEIILISPSQICLASNCNFCVITMSWSRLWNFLSYFLSVSCWGGWKIEQLLWWVPGSLQRSTHYSYELVLIFGLIGKEVIKRNLKKFLLIAKK